MGVKAGRYESDLIKDIVECEGVTILWGVNDTVLTLHLCYRPTRYPGGGDDNSYSYSFCELLSGIKGQVVSCGDLNFSGIDWKRLHTVSLSGRIVLETVQKNFGTQYVDFPPDVGGARKVGGEDEVGRYGKTLDLDLASVTELVEGVVDEGLFGDHRIIH